MTKIVPIILALALSACTAGQVFGPSLRSGCQAEELAYDSVQADILIAVTTPGTTPEHKVALQKCNAEAAKRRDACEQNPSLAGAAAMAEQTKTCKTLLTGGQS